MDQWIWGIKRFDSSPNSVNSRSVKWVVCKIWSTQAILRGFQLRPHGHPMAWSPGNEKPKPSPIQGLRNGPKAIPWFPIAMKPGTSRGPQDGVTLTIVLNGFTWSCLWSCNGTKILQQNGRVGHLGDRSILLHVLHALHIVHILHVQSHHALHDLEVPSLLAVKTRKTETKRLETKKKTHIAWIFCTMLGVQSGLCSHGNPSTSFLTQKAPAGQS